jgi:hypothetical protein
MAVESTSARPEDASPVEPWEVHSELVLVSPEVRKHALEVLAREHTVHSLRYRPVEGERKQTSAPAPLAIALGVYVARAVAHALVPALVAFGGTVAFAVALELLNR